MMRYAPLDSEIFINNRYRFTDRLKPKSIAVFHSSDVMPKSADGIYPFVQQSDLFYLCGIDQEETILLLCPDAYEESDRVCLFIKETNKNIARWEGPKYTTKEASQISGIKTVFWTSHFKQRFRQLVVLCDYIYLNTNEHARANLEVETRDSRFIQWCIKTYPLHTYERAAKIMNTIRMIKTDQEIDVILRACDITHKIFSRLLKFIKPNVWEFEIEAEIVHECIRNRSKGPAFEPIVASGKNSCILHYVKNNKQCKSDELVLLDFGAEYAGYAADITRTLPVNGVYSDRQKAVYNAVLNVQRAAINLLTPSNSFKDYKKAVGKIMENELIRLGLLDEKKVQNQDPEKPLYQKYFMHGASHFIGLDVHDSGYYETFFLPGMLLSCEPGIYIEEEEFGIRLEDDILITPKGPVNLTSHIPIQAHEIEMLMK